jgi:hypothetical protein
MALSPSHRFGQIIGELLEVALFEPLQEVATEFGFYFDYKHLRSARGGKKVTWKDAKGNQHDLDYVFEEGGSETIRGQPKAFIETAWRRYTKHSRNKAQEMQGAIQPLAETYSHCHPFLGVVLAGKFTAGSLTQLTSHGFHILFYPYETIIELFSRVGIDARFDEDTPDADLQAKVDAFDALSEGDKERLAASFRDVRKDELKTFIDGLRVVLNRSIEIVYILPLHGKATQVLSVEEAIDFITRYDESTASNPFVRFEVNVRYTNGNEIRGQFNDKATAIDFLRKLVPMSL